MYKIKISNMSVSEKWKLDIYCFVCFKVRLEYEKQKVRRVCVGFLGQLVMSENKVLSDKHRPT